MATHDRRHLVGAGLTILPRWPRGRAGGRGQSANSGASEPGNALQLRAERRFGVASLGGPTRPIEGLVFNEK